MTRLGLTLYTKYLAINPLLPSLASALPRLRLPTPSIPHARSSLPSSLSKSIAQAQNVLETNEIVDQFLFCGNLGLGARGSGEGTWLINEEDEEEDGVEDDYDEDGEDEPGAVLLDSFYSSDDRPSTSEEHRTPRDLPPDDESISEPEKPTSQQNQFYPTTIFHSPSLLDPYTYYPPGIFSSSPNYHLHGIAVPRELHQFHPDTILAACGNVLRGEGDGEKLNWKREDYDERINYELVWF